MIVTLSGYSYLTRVLQVLVFLLDNSLQSSKTLVSGKWKIVSSKIRSPISTDKILASESTSLTEMLEQASV
jgi:hypothetical protein